MANIRSLKNEINYLSYEIISDCNTFISIHPEKREQALALVDQAVELRNDLIAKLNNPKEVTAKYFRALKVELIDGADNIFEDLRKLIG